MDKELKEALTQLMRTAPGNENWTWDMLGKSLSKIKLIEPLNWDACRNWRGKSGNHILEDDVT